MLVSWKKERKNVWANWFWFWFWQDEEKQYEWSWATRESEKERREPDRRQKTKTCPFTLSGAYLFFFLILFYFLPTRLTFQSCLGFDSYSQVATISMFWVPCLRIADNFSLKYSVSTWWYQFIFVLHLIKNFVWWDTNFQPMYVKIKSLWLMMSLRMLFSLALSSSWMTRKNPNFRFAFPFSFSLIHLTHPTTLIVPCAVRSSMGSNQFCGSIIQTHKSCPWSWCHSPHCEHSQV